MAEPTPSQTEAILSSTEEGKKPVHFLPNYKSVNRWTKSVKKRDNPYVLSWKNLTYTVKEEPKRELGTGKAFNGMCAKKQDKVVLKNLNGYVKPGQFLAIIGPSGSGKTSLLNVLAQRVSERDGIVTGDILLNGKPVQPKNFKRVSGYVMQDDIMLSFLTVRETLSFTARLRLPRSVTKEEKDRHVEDVIEELGLHHAAATLIGNDKTKGVSGGERKRVNIANELVAEPILMFLDEPTSGLDAFTALSVVNTLDTLARNNYSVICTIHQPRYNIFEMFDQLLILSNGESIYFGPAKDAVAYFSSLNYPCPQYYNPADHFIDLVTQDDRTPETKEITTKRITQLSDAFKKSPMATDAANPVFDALHQDDSYGQNRRRFAWEQLPVLLERSFRNTYRNKFLTVYRLFQDVFMGLIIGLAFLQLDNNQVGVQNFRGVMFIILVQEMWGALNIAMNVFPQDRAVFWRERGSGTYGSLVYYLAWQIVTLPQTLFFPLVFAVICYWMVGMKPSASHFFLALLIIELLNLVAESLGLMIICWIPKKVPASLVGLVFLLFFMIFGGFYLNDENAPKYFIWLQWLSFVRYGFEAICINEFKGRSFVCEFNETTSNFTVWASQNNYSVSDFAYNSTNGLIYSLTTPNLTFNNDSLSACQFATGEDVLRQLSFSVHSSVILRNLVIMGGLAIFYRIVAYLGLRFQKPVEETY